MKNLQKGFVAPLIIAIAVLVIGGGVYFYEKNVKSKRPISFLNTELSATYNVLANENSWRAELIPTENPEAWPVSEKNITVKAINYQNDFSCGDKKTELIRYSSYNTGAIGGWDSVSIVDCGAYYFVFEYGDSGPKLFGPFDKSDIPASNAVQSTNKPGASNTTSNWKTYVNSEVGYSISYPSTYHPAYGNDLFNFDENKYEKGNSAGVKIQIQKTSGNVNASKADVPTIKYSEKVTSGPGGTFDIYSVTGINGTKYFQILVWGMENDSQIVSKILSTFQFTPVTSVNSVPVNISGISGPTSLNDGQSGTWTVYASGEKPLTYGVIWGNEPEWKNVFGGMPLSAIVYKSDSSFSHAYPRVSSTGTTWTPAFFVKDAQGKTTRKGSPVNVGFASSQTPIPYIGSITPSSATVGTTIEIRGSSFKGFEGDVYFFFERADGRKVRLPGVVSEQITGDATGAQTARIVIKEPCQPGQTMYGDYSGIPYQCDYVQFTPGVYKVSTETWGNKSNTVQFTVVD